MRIVVANSGGEGHVRPFLPLLDALRAAGHELFVVTTVAESAAAFTSAGCDTISVALTHERFDPMDVAALPSSERPDFVIGGFLTLAVDTARAIIDRFAAEPPDVLLRDVVGWGAWLAGDVLDLPVASFDFSPIPAPLFATRFSSVLNDARRAVGLRPDEFDTLDGGLTVVGAPPGWLLPHQLTPTTHLVQPPPDQPGDERPAWLTSLPSDRPTVYLTMGTVFNQTPGLFPTLFEALEDLDATIICTTGRNLDTDTLGDPPANMLVEQFVPQDLVLPHCDAVIAHGGYGSTMGALRRGLPLVCVPLASLDNIMNAQRVTALGAGITVAEDERSPLTIRTAVERLLAEPSWRRSAQDVASSIAAQPPIRTAVALIERLAETRAPVTSE